MAVRGGEAEFGADDIGTQSGRGGCIGGNAMGRAVDRVGLGVDPDVAS